MKATIGCDKAIKFLIYIIYIYSSGILPNMQSN